jgi:hypothetical protein
MDELGFTLFHPKDKSRYQSSSWLSEAVSPMGMGKPNAKRLPKEIVNDKRNLKLPFDNNQIVVYLYQWLFY